MTTEQVSTPPAEGSTSEATPAPSESPTLPVESVEPDAAKTFDAAYVKQLRTEAAGNRKRASEAETRLAELEERDKSDAQKAQTKAERAEARATEAESKLLRYEVATEKKIPADAMDLLVGDTREELEAKADKLLALTKASAATPEFDGGVREPAPEPKSPEDSHKDTLMGLFGRGNEPTNP